MLTAKQHDLLLFINKCLNESGISPSFDEMKDALGLASKSGIHRLITALEERGFIRRLAHRARALEVVKLPKDLQDNAPKGAKIETFKPAINTKDMRFDIPEAANSIDIPLLGRIAAGTPIEAISHETARISAPSHLIGRGEHFALTVQGDSMVDVGILDGDTVIIRRADTAQSGEIIVALVDDEEATLKRLRKKNGAIALEAANPDYETRIFGPNRVKVQGTLVGLVRSYH
jgi:repressor LexA